MRNIKKAKIKISVIPGWPEVNLFIFNNGGMVLPQVATVPISKKTDQG
jgi:hypothetical protein